MSAPIPVEVVPLDNGDTAGTMLFDSGVSWPWLVSADPRGRPTGCACATCAPHEQDSFRPWPWRCSRIKATP
jgi:hypothetical protein